jgi:hypothetical protein
MSNSKHHQSRTEQPTATSPCSRKNAPPDLISALSRSFLQLSPAIILLTVATSTHWLLRRAFGSDQIVRVLLTIEIMIFAPCFVAEIFLHSSRQVIHSAHSAVPSALREILTIRDESRKFLAAWRVAEERP